MSDVKGNFHGTAPSAQSKALELLLARSSENALGGQAALRLVMLLLKEHLGDTDVIIHVDDLNAVEDEHTLHVSEASYDEEGRKYVTISLAKRTTKKPPFEVVDAQDSAMLLGYVKAEKTN